MIIHQCSGQKGGFGFGFPAGRLCWKRKKVSQEWITEKLMTISHECIALADIRVNLRAWLSPLSPLGTKNESS
jgi:hypothetical protein